MRKAYNDTVEDMGAVAEEPQTLASGVILGRMSVQATGFASKLKIDDTEFDPELGPKHLIPGLPAIVSGRYRQIREGEEGRRGMAELADIEAKFNETGVRPTHEEMDLCRDHALEVA